MRSKSFFHSNSRGFTILELLIATTVFSIVILLAATAIIQVGRTYYKGNQQTRTQEVTREIIDQISRDIQFSGATITASNTAYDDVFQAQTEAASQNSFWGDPGFVDNEVQTFCIGQKRYMYLLNRRLEPKFSPVPLTTTEKFLWSQALIAYNDEIGCPTYHPTDLINLSGHNYKELLSPGMILAKLQVEQVDAINHPDLWQITIKIINTADKDFINTASPWECNKDRSSSQFCAESELHTTVQKRVE